MDSFNKIISFVLGLIVVVVLLVILTGRFNLREKFLPLQGLTKTSPTVTPTPQTTTRKGGQKVVINPTGISTNYRPYNQTSQTGGAVTSIPKTGPALLLPFALSGLFGGVFIRSKAKK